MKDDVTAFWDAIRAKWPVPVAERHDLPPQDQHMLIQAINTVLFLLNKNQKGS